MGQIKTSADTVYRDKVTPGSADLHEPAKPEIRTLFGLVDDLITAATADVAAAILSGGNVYPDTAAGLAAVGEGLYFFVPVTDGLELFRDLSGVAVSQGVVPDTVYLAAVQAATEEARDEAVAAVDEVLAGVGTFIGNLDSVDLSLQGIDEPNELNNADMMAAPYPVSRSGSPIVDLTDQADLIERGILRAIRWRTGGNEHVLFDTGAPLANQYVMAAALFYSANPAHLPATTNLFASPSIDEITATSGVTTITPNLVFSWRYGQAGGAVSDEVVAFGSNAHVGSDTDPTYIALPYFRVSATALDAAEIAAEVVAVLAAAFSRGQLNEIASDYLIDGGHVGAEVRVQTASASLATTKLSGLSVANLYVNGDFSGDPVPERRSKSVLIALSDQADLMARGFRRAFRWYTGVGEYARFYSPTSLEDRYIFGAFLAYSEDPAHLPDVGVIYTEAAPTSTVAPPDVTSPTAVASGVVDLTDNLRLVWSQVLVTVNQDRLIVGSATTGTDTDPLFATGFFAHSSATEIDSLALVDELVAALSDLQARENYAVAASLNAPTRPVGLLSLNGEGIRDTASSESFFDTALADFNLRRTFNPFPPVAFTVPQVFNFMKDIIVGGGIGGADLILRDAADDVAPYRMGGTTTIGGNHGYRVGLCTATAHGKDVTDLGSVWANSGDQFVLMSIVDANTLYLARRADDSVNAFATGVFTHVSGAVHTGSITVSGVAMTDAWPVTQNHEKGIYVDNVPVTARAGDYDVHDRFSFSESFEIIDRPNWITWFEANADTGAIQPSTATPQLACSMNYQFDMEGGCFVSHEVVAMKTATIRELMLMQGGVMLDNDGSPRRYIPKVLPVTHEGTAYDFAMIDDADTSGWTTPLDFTPARCVATGLLADRIITLTDNYGFAMGYMPELSADPSVRRTLCARTALTLSHGAAAGKGYLYAVSSDAITSMALGDSYAIKGYRVLFKLDPARTALYCVRTDGVYDYIYADWHNTTKIDRLPIPQDFVGRPFTVVEALNADPLSQALNAKLAVAVTTAGAYGYLILRVAR